MASSMKVNRIALRFLPLLSATLMVYIQSACTHSRGEKNSNFRCFSLSAARTRCSRFSPMEHTSRERLDEEIVPLIAPSLRNCARTVVAVRWGFASKAFINTAVSDSESERQLPASERTFGSSPAFPCFL